MTSTHSRTHPSRENSLVRGGVLMIVLTVLLSWLPLVGPFVAGFVGGRVIGEEKRSLSVALIPAVLLALVLWLILAVFDLPILGAVAGVGALVVVAVQEIPLLAGAWFGGSSTGTTARAS